MPSFLDGRAGGKDTLEELPEEVSIPNILVYQYTSLTYALVLHNQNLGHVARTVCGILTPI